MRGEIKQLHQEIATTMIYVTHDQIEAMTLAERIVLMRDGVIEQQGAPLELFERPASRFVAGFLGSPQMSFLPGRCAPRRRRPSASATGPVFPCRAAAAGRGADGTAVLLGLRPEHMTRAHGTPAEGPSARRDDRARAADGLAELRHVPARRRAGDGRAAGPRREPAGRAIAIDINLSRAALFDAKSERAM